MTREDLRPRTETTLRDLCALLYPATAGHDVVVYATGDGPWSARWAWTRAWWTSSRCRPCPARCSARRSASDPRPLARPMGAAPLDRGVQRTTVTDHPDGAADAG